ncbi:hypothetical protein Gotri_020893 [Gossypium trilobum]|uniref:Flowering time control protein FCA n=1 Tax=Gossypium trilobum TaxID=34281 RepID=A0A7J9DAY7_9ROSI|nr:hypothetical protein [Gossypium trilobum]
MERHRDRGERFNDHPPLNPTPWYTNAQRPNFPPDYHHQHHYHPYNHHHNPQQFDYCPTQQQFDHLPAQQQFDHRPTQQPFEHRPTQQQFDHRPNQQPFEHRPNQQPFEHRPNQQQFDHRPTQQQFEHQSSQQQFEHQPGNQHHFERFPEQHQQPISEQNDAFWSNGGNGPNAGRKRGFHDSGRGASPGYCFVKYAMFEEAERAIAALNNRYMFPGESTTIKVRYADAERDRPGPLPDKLYVGCLNKQASKREIEEIFSHYGHVLDVFIMRDEHREHRGCGFVQFSQRDMAQAAIRGLSGIFTMKGCDQPLIVRSANPKRPRNGEPRGNYAFNSMPSGPHPQELAMRSMPNLGDSMAGHIPPNASYPGQHISTNPQPQGVSHWANPQVAACHVTYQSYPPVQQAHSQPTSLPSQQTQTLQGSSQSSHPADSEQKQQPLIPPASQVPSQQNGNVPKLEVARESNLSLELLSVVATIFGLTESPQTGSSQPIAATSVVPIVPQSLETVALQESDWSEHTCPEGNKYYYNCVTCESRWNKPEEFALFEKLLQKQQKVQNPSQHIQPDSTGPSVKQVSQSQEVQLQTYPMHLKLEVEQPFSTLGMGHMEIKSETSPVVDPTCV